MHGDGGDALQCWLDALPVELIDHEVARRHPSIPFYLAFAYPRFARYCRERYRLPRDPLSWFARVPTTKHNSSLYDATWCTVNHAIYLPDDHPRLKRIAEITNLGASKGMWEIAAIADYHVRYARAMIGLLPRYDGATPVLHSWWDDDLDQQRQWNDGGGGGGGGDDVSSSHGVDVVAVQQNQYDALTMLLHRGGYAFSPIVIWYRYGVCHRDGDRPASVRRDGHREWHRNGVLHRDGDLAALVSHGYRGGGGGGVSMHWYRNGTQHRDGDRPSLVASGSDANTTAWMQWHKDGKLHRDGDKPAEIRSLTPAAFFWREFIVAFYQDGALHRDDRDAPSLLTDECVEWHCRGTRQRRLLSRSAWLSYSDQVAPWIEYCVQSGKHIVSASPSCPYFGVAIHH